MISRQRLTRIKYLAQKAKMVYKEERRNKKEKRSLSISGPLDIYF